MIVQITKLVRKMPELRDYQFFDIAWEIVDFSQAVLKDTLNAYCDKNDNSYAAGDDVAVEGYVPSSSKLPAKKTAIFIGRRVFLMEYTDFEGRRAVQISRLCEDGGSKLIGGYVPGAVSWVPRGSETDWFGVPHRYLVHVCAHILALINEPRVLKREKAGSRNHRRLARRGFGFAVDAWTRVSWDLSKATRKKLSRDPNFHCKAMHFRRGHHREAKSHYKGAFQRLDALRPEDREKWWQWIEGRYVGHPAFGLRTSVHAPKMSTGKLASRFLDRQSDESGVPA